MFRFMRGRVFWGVAGIAAAAYLLRRSRKSPVEVLRYAGESEIAGDVMRAGRTALEAAVRAGRTIAGEAARVLSRR